MQFFSILLLILCIQTIYPLVLQLRPVKDISTFQQKRIIKIESEQTDIKIDPLQSEVEPRRKVPIEVLHEGKPACGPEPFPDISCEATTCRPRKTKKRKQVRLHEMDETTCDTVPATTRTSSRLLKVNKNKVDPEKTLRSKKKQPKKKLISNKARQKKLLLQKLIQIEVQKQKLKWEKLQQEKIEREKLQKKLKEDMIRKKQLQQNILRQKKLKQKMLRQKARELTSSTHPWLSNHAITNAKTGIPEEQCRNNIATCITAWTATKVG